MGKEEEKAEEKDKPRGEEDSQEKSLPERLGEVLASAGEDAPSRLVDAIIGEAIDAGASIYTSSRRI